MMQNNIPDKIIVYGHPACPGVPPVRALLWRSGAAFAYINIYQDIAARQHVREINSGYESVPTLVFPDGSTLTEPSIGELKRKLESLGYRVPLSAWLLGNMQRVVLGVLLLYVLLRVVGVL